MKDRTLYRYYNDKKVIRKSLEIYSNIGLVMQPIILDAKKVDQSWIKWILNSMLQTSCMIGVGNLL